MACKVEYAKLYALDLKMRTVLPFVRYKTLNRTHMTSKCVQFCALPGARGIFEAEKGLPVPAIIAVRAYC